MRNAGRNETGQQALLSSIPLNEHVLIGVVQHRSESGGAVATTRSDAGGQLFIFELDLPMEVIQGSMR